MHAPIYIHVCVCLSHPCLVTTYSVWVWEAWSCSCWKKWHRTINALNEWLESQQRGVPGCPSVTTIYNVVHATVGYAWISEEWGNDESGIVKSGDRRKSVEWNNTVKVCVTEFVKWVRRCREAGKSQTSHVDSSSWCCNKQVHVESEMTLITWEGVEMQCICGSLSEWLRRWTRNPLGSARAGSNPAAVALWLLCTNQLDSRVELGRWAEELM